jgi:hypothetical protein
LNKIKIANCIGIGGCLGVVGKQSMSQINNFYFIFFKSKCGRYCFLNLVCCWKFQKFAKIGFGRRN